jgi:outer membrane lipoprotein-sorting protein
MRRVTLLLALLLAFVGATAGCSGKDAEEAHQLLEQSNAAFAQVQSATFRVQLTFSGGPEELQLSNFVMTMKGGGYQSGKRAGDFYVVMAGPGMLGGEVVMVSRGGRVSMTLNGSPMGSFPVPEQDTNPIQLVDFARYVEKVTVEHNTLIDGQLMAKVSGTIDTAGLADGVLSSLPNSGAPELDYSKALGDTHMTLYLSEETHLPMRGLADMTMEIAGERIRMQLDFAYTSYNKSLRFPGLR